MLISDVTSKVPRHKRRKRVGRGQGSGHGKTAGRGSKGLQSRTGARQRVLFEGGGLPLFRRVRKRGFNNANFRTEYQVVNVATLEEHFDNGAKVTPVALEELGLIHRASAPVKILGTGDIKKKLDVEATAFSKSASEKIEKAGGKAVTPKATA
jgi:large subunit ribosomal protein L15